MPTRPAAADLVLVACTRSRPELLRDVLLPSLAEAVGDHPVVVVDQSPDDLTAQLLDGLAGVTRITSATGLSRGRNAAIAATTAPFIAFTDDDVSLPPGWLDRFVGAFDDPEVGVVCGRATTPDGTLLPGTAEGRYRWPTSAFGLGSGFNVAFRRAALEAVGPFDEELGAGTVIGAGEDTDMMYRLLRAGYVIWCRDDITVVHDDWRDARQEASVNFRYGQGVGAQTVKHVREGDRTALLLGLRSIGSQIFWLSAWLSRREWSALRRHPPFLAGIFVGAVRRTRQDHRRRRRGV